jgi:hypothetical protein
MKVRARLSFVATLGDRKIRVVEGELLDIPDVLDWVRGGLVQPLEGSALAGQPVREIAAVAPAERAVAPEPQPRVMGIGALHPPAPGKSEAEAPVKRPRKKRT